ncbi:MAG: EVE domain-containing protein [Alphaproteobacteria bacterium]
MAYWLVKSEPGAWSWDDQVKAGKKGTGWDGVRNHQAANNMKAMKLGDRCFFYHSVNEKQIVGIVEVVKLYHPDPTDKAGKFGMVDVAAVAPFKTPVTLAQIKADEALSQLPLVKQSRLSVMPIDAKSWKAICKLGGVKG